MRRFLATFFCILGLAVPLASSSVAQGYPQGSLMQTAPASDVPLVVIRFNQSRVLFERQLYNAIAKAVEIKPSVLLEVVSFVPQTGNARSNEKLLSQASSQTASVINSLKSMGIPQKRMKISQEDAPGLRYHEVHVYVQ